MSTSVGSTTAGTIDEFLKNYSTTSTESAASTSTTSDKDIFLNLLVTQMQYQDPLDPQDNSEYLSQMAQFTTLEIMENLQSSSEMSQATGMIGKVVSATDTNGNTVVGIVEGTKVVAGEVYLRMGDQDIELGKVQAVTTQTSADESILDYTKLTYANSLVGKIVAGTQTSTSADGATSENVFSALVQSATSTDGKIVLNCYSVTDGSSLKVELGEIEEVTEMVPAEEDILEYVKKLYEIMTSTTDSADSLEEELADVTE